MAEHSWRTALMAMLLTPELLSVNMDRVIRMCLIHDLGEAFTGDIPAFDKKEKDGEEEEKILEKWVDRFSSPQREEWLELLREMDAQETLEARVYKALDKMEAVIQHDEADLSSWLPLEYELQLVYGKENVKCHPWLEGLKAAIDEVTLEKIKGKRPEDAKALGEQAPEVICMGSAVVDITAKPIGEGGWQEKQRIETIRLGAGGDSVNQSIRLAEEGIRVGICARLGKDSNGNFLAEHLEKNGVETSYLAADEQAATGTSLVLVDDEGERHTFSVKGAHSNLDRQDTKVVLQKIREQNGLRALSLASIFSMPLLEDEGLLEILQEAKRHGILVFADLASDKRRQGLDGVRSFLPYIDYFMPSDYDACKLTGKETVEEAADVLLGCGAVHVAIKCGAKGCYAKSPEMEGAWIPALSVEAVNTTGAGDSMTAFFIGRILRGDDFLTAGAYACSEASKLVGGLR